MIGTKAIQMVDLHGQYLRIKDSVDAGIQSVIESSQFVRGAFVEKFARNLENYLQVKQVIPCGNGTDALMIALMALDLKAGDEVITVSHSFVSTAEVIRLLGLKPVFVDIHPETFNMDVSLLEQAITPKTKCIIPVHLFGQGCDMKPILDLAHSKNLFVIEDNAQSIGAEYKNHGKYGTLGHIATTSFYPSKNLGAYGDAGAIFTNDEELGKKIAQICNHGQEKKYFSKLLGVNSRLDGMQAVVLDAKLELLDEFIEDRRRAARFYDEKFESVQGIKIPNRSQFSSHVFHQYNVTLEGNRDEIRTALKEAGVPSMVYYPHPIHTMPGYNANNTDLSITERMAKQTLALPMHTELDEEQLTYITNKLIEVIK